MLLQEASRWNRNMFFVMLELLLLLSALLVGLFIMRGAAVEVDNPINVTIETVFQRKLFYEQGRWWLFYQDYPTSNIVLRTSIDSVTWSTVQNVTSPSRTARDFSLIHHSPNISYAFISNAINLTYRQGLLLANGEITWYAAEQNVLSTTGAPNTLQSVAITVDSSSFPYIVFGNWTFLPLRKSWVVKSSLMNGTWQTAVGYPQQLGGDDDFPSNIVALTNDKLFVSYANTTILKGKVFNGSNWLSEETILERTSDWSDESIWHLSMVAVDDDVYLATTDSSRNLFFAKRSYALSTWSSEIISIEKHAPSLSVVGTTSVFVWSYKTSLLCWRRYDVSTGIFDNEANLGIGEIETNNLSTSYAANSATEVAVAYQTLARTNPSSSLQFEKISGQQPLIFIPPSSKSPSIEEPAEEVTEVEQPLLPKLGLWGLIGAVGLIAVGGVLSVVGSSAPSHRRPKPVIHYRKLPPKQNVRYRRLK